MTLALFQRTIHGDERPVVPSCGVAESAQRAAVNREIAGSSPASTATHPGPAPSEDSKPTHARIDTSGVCHLSAARAARDAGIAQAESSEQWNAEEADRAFEAFCRGRDLVFADDFHAHTKGAFVHRAFGGVMKRAISSGKIEATPETRPSIQSQCSRRTVYRSLLRGQP